MIQSIVPRLPAKDLEATCAFYESVLGFRTTGIFPEYRILVLEPLEIHFYLHTTLDVYQNTSMLYLRVPAGIEQLYEQYRAANAPFASQGHLRHTAWGTIEFALLDPNHTLLTFGQLQA